MTEQVFIGLGSNLDQPLAQLRSALQALAEVPDTVLVACSSFYASKPMGPQDQPDYVNAVAQLETTLSPESLLDQLQAIEQHQGRVRKGTRWGPRTLDLDIILFGNRNLQTERLTVPHYGMQERPFVLVPLAEIAPDLRLPCGNTLKSILNKHAETGLTRLGESPSTAADNNISAEDTYVSKG